MLSTIHRLVANRADFQSAELSSSLDFTPASASSEAVEVRKRMDLFRTDTDYFVCGAVSALLACPALMLSQGVRLLGHPSILSAGMRPTFTPPSGVTLVNSNFRMASVARKVNAWPISLTMRLVRLDDRNASCSFTGEPSQTISTRLLGDTLIVEWPADSGIHGNLRLTQPSSWADNVTLDFLVEPSNYPAAKVYEWVRLSGSWATLMQSAGMLSIADGARNLPVDHVAMLSMALALDTIRNR